MTADTTAVETLNVVPTWMIFAFAEVGVAEVAGAKQHHPRIVEYHATTTLGGGQADETPWCSSFVGWCMQRAQRPTTKSAAARSWMNWGTPLQAPRFGCVVIFTRDDPANPNAGHAAFFVSSHGPDPRQLVVLGGNQGNRVSLALYPRARAIGYRWPKGESV